MFRQRSGLAARRPRGFRRGGFRPGFRRASYPAFGFGYPYGYPLGYPYGYPGLNPFRSRRPRKPPGEWDEEDEILLQALKEKRRDEIAQEFGLSGMSDDSVKGLGEYELVNRREGTRVHLEPTGTPFVRVISDVPYRGPRVITDRTPFQNPAPFQSRDIPRYVGWRSPMMRMRRGMNVNYPL